MIRILQQGDDAHMNETEDDAGKLPAALDETELFLCALADIPEAGAHAVQVHSATGGFPLLLTRQGSAVQAFHNECPHAGRRLDWTPGRFLIENDLLVCAAHGAAFTRDSGLCLAGPCRGQGLVRFPIKIVGDSVFIAR